MGGEFILELFNPGAATSSTDRRRFSLRPDGHSPSQDRKARRQRTAPYPPQIPAPVANSPELSNRTATEALLRDPRDSEHPIDPSCTTSPKTNPRFARLANRNVEHPDPGPSNPIINLGLHEDSSSNGVGGATLGVMTAAVGPSTRNLPVTADDEVAVLAKKILEYYKKAGVGLGIGSETGEGEHNPPSQDEDEEIGPERLYENLKVVRVTRPFQSSSGQGETVWWSSSSGAPINCPPSKVEPELGDLYIHRMLDDSSTQIWLAYEPLEWTKLKVEYMETYLPDRVIKDVRHPTFHDRLLKIWKNGEPSWAKQASCATVRSRNKE